MYTKYFICVSTPAVVGHRITKTTRYRMNTSHLRIWLNCVATRMGVWPANCISINCRPFIFAIFRLVANVSRRTSMEKFIYIFGLLFDIIASSIGVTFASVVFRYRLLRLFTFFFSHSHGGTWSTRREREAYLLRDLFRASEGWNWVRGTLTVAHHSDSIHFMSVPVIFIHQVQNSWKTTKQTPWMCTCSELHDNCICFFVFVSLLYAFIPNYFATWIETNLNSDNMWSPMSARIQIVFVLGYDAFSMSCVPMVNCGGDCSIILPHVRCDKQVLAV